MICTNKQFKAVPILLDNCSVEMCSVRIIFQHGNVIIVAAYIPSVSAASTSCDLLAKFESFYTYVENLQQSYPQDRRLVVGDFNVSKLK